MVNRVVTSYYSAILDPSSEIDISALHFVFLPRIAMSLEEFTAQWNYHGIRTAGHSAPLALWSYGMVSFQSNDNIVDLNNYGIDHGVLCEDTSDGIIVFRKTSFFSMMKRWHLFLQTLIY